MLLRLLCAGLVCSCFIAIGQAPVKLKESNHIYLDALITQQSPRPQVRIAFAVDRLIDKHAVNELEIHLKLRHLPSLHQLFDTTITLSGTLPKQNEYFIYTYQLPLLKEEARLHISIIDHQTQEHLSQALVIYPFVSEPDFEWANLSRENCFTPSINDSLMFKTSVHKKLWVYRYKTRYYPAELLYEEGKKRSVGWQVLDSVFEIITNDALVFSERALYHVRSDTTKDNGLCIRVSSKSFPEVRTVEELMHALIYIASKPDIHQMITTSNKKHTLDVFWLNAGGSEWNARRLIRTYYQRVNFANFHYSSYKLGWKTDKGMVYILFGKPDKIIKSLGYETWFYAKKNGRKKQAKFRFKHQSDWRSINNYVLIRQKSLKSVWQEQVINWWKGNIYTYD